jgi:hypothetical protein
VPPESPPESSPAVAGIHWRAEYRDGWPFASATDPHNAPEARAARFGAIRERVRLLERRCREER